MDSTFFTCVDDVHIKKARNISKYDEFVPRMISRYINMSENIKALI